MSQPEPAHSKAEPEAVTVKTKSKGEKYFDRAVYGGIAALGTFVLTVPVTYLLKYHGPVQPYFNRAVDATHRLLKKLPFAVGRPAADKVLTTTALMMGGNMMLLPIGVAEKHKTQIVEGLNTALGDPTPIEQVEKAPKQTWGSLIESRLVAWLAVFTAFTTAGKFVPKTLTMFENEVGERMCQLFGKPKERRIAGKLVETKTFVFGKIGALDFFATIAAATLLYVGGHFFARRHEEKKQQREERHEHAGASRDEVETALPPIAELPAKAAASEIRGEKQHDGKLAASLKEAAVGA